jgi:hypothetical protein
LIHEIIKDICDLFCNRLASTRFRDDVARSFLKTGTMHVMGSEAIREALIKGIEPDDDDCDD